MIRPCSGGQQPKVEGRYLAFVAKTSQWEICFWGGARPMWHKDGVPLNPVCWTTLPEKPSQ
jgi:hypothetical protein